MNPNYPYDHTQQRPSSRSLAATTTTADPRYQQYPAQYQGAAPPHAYNAYAGAGYDPAAFQGYPAGDARRGAAPAPPASYPGAVRTSSPPSAVTMSLNVALAQTAAVHQYATGHPASAPGALAYAAHGHAPLSPPHTAAGGHAYHGHHASGRAHGHAHGHTSSASTAHPPSSPYTAHYLPTPAQTMALPAHAPGGGSSSSSAHAHGHQRRPSAPHGAPPGSPELERFPCDRCDKTFSRAHDRKRHYESQHAPHPSLHRCRFCAKEFSRSDSLKRHLDNGCERDPAFVDGAAP